eukprot:11164863-Lingulodinium_polyedra.AAC.1
MQWPVAQSPTAARAADAAAGAGEANPYSEPADHGRDNVRGASRRAIKHHSSGADSLDGCRAWVKNMSIDTAARDGATTAGPSATRPSPAVGERRAPGGELVLRQNDDEVQSRHYERQFAPPYPVVPWELLDE